MKLFFTLFALLWSLSIPELRAVESDAGEGVAGVSGEKAAAELKLLVLRQQELLASAASKQSQDELNDLREPLQQLVFDYEEYVRKYPGFAAGYVSYALLLNHPAIDERKRAAALLLKANQLNPDLPLVKNQLGNYLAEAGRPLEALNYYLAAVRLDQREPLYHFQIGMLLTAARDDFLKSGQWTRQTLDETMHDAFEQAMMLTPGNVEYALAYCKSFYELDRPDWDEALRNWRGLELKMATSLGKQTVRLHQVQVLLNQKDFTTARTVLATVDDAALDEQKQKLVAQLAAAPAK